MMGIGSPGILNVKASSMARILKSSSGSFSCQTARSSFPSLSKGFEVLSLRIADIFPSLGQEPPVGLEGIPLALHFVPTLKGRFERNGERCEC
jgi:hypothetical protein